MKNANNIAFYRASIHCPHCSGPIDVEVPLKSVEARIAELEGCLKNIGEHAERVRCSRGTSIEADESDQLLELVAAALREGKK